MASTYSTDLSLELVTTGEKAGLWGTIQNTNLQILQASSSGVIDVAMTSGSDVTLDLSDGSSSANGKNLYIRMTGTMTGNISLIMPASTTGGAATRVFVVQDATNRTNTKYTINVKTAGSSNPVPHAPGSTVLYQSNATDTVAGLVKKGFYTINSSAITTYTAVPNDQIIAITNTNPITITLPSAATIGDEITIMDGGNYFASNKVEIARNGHNINAAASNLDLQTNNQSTMLVYVNATVGWIQKFNNT